MVLLLLDVESLRRPFATAEPFPATTGQPWLGFGLGWLSAPFCGCTIAHDWSVAVQANSVTWTVPSTESVIGVQLFTQGLDLFGTGGCPSPPVTLTDAIILTIG